ncbi:MAG: DUF2889 domain-containing protein [Pseudomonadota bacterium]
MNLLPPAPRSHKHARSISCEGYQREDGLWDIEARIVDTKTFSYREAFRGLREPGEAVHDMALRLTIDNDMVVRDIEVATLSAPYAPCFAVAPAFKELIGKKIGAGWRHAVQACVGGVKGCTHLRELLLPAATVAFQTLGSWPEDGQPVAPRAPEDKAERPYFIDGCKAWAADGEIVAAIYPAFQRKPD